MVISAERPAEPAAMSPPEAARAREEASGSTGGGQNLLHNFSFPILKTWGNQRLLRCANVNRNGEAIGGGGGRRSAAVTRVRVPSEGIKLEEVRKKLLVHLREAADRINLAVRQDPDQEPDPDLEPEREPEPSSSAAAAASRPWNLRARRGTAAEQGLSPSPARAAVAVERRTVRLRSEDAERKCRPRFSISLSVDEIEEDIYAVTGSRARRRPRKRPRVVQKQLDALFPGSWLSEITLESYRVPE
ncbi:uncharacterized protein [Typha latifolia]|uniref:uncharacterized protein n=1 Tax=Typha latifolia TaxID=4733 RepID=UPI003C2BF1C9